MFMLLEFSYLQVFFLLLMICFSFYQIYAYLLDFWTNFSWNDCYVINIMFLLKVSSF